jgi:hypothetical protein
MPYAWPLKYMIELSADVVALGAFNHTLIAVTTQKPVILTGMPGAIQPITLNDPRAGTSKRNVLSTPGGVLYAAIDGLFLIRDTGGSLVMDGAYNRRVFSALTLTGSSAIWFDDKYILFLGSSNTAIVFDFREKTVVTMTLTTGSVVYATQVAEGDQPLFLEKVAAGTYHLKELFDSSTDLTMTYKGRVERIASGNLAVFRIRGDQSMSNAVTLTLWADGINRHECKIADKEIHTLPGGFLNTEFEWQIVSAVEIFTIDFASAPEELL